MPDQVTDAAREMGTLIDWVRALEAPAQQPGQQPEASWQVLSRGLKLDAGSPEFIEVLAAVRSRLARLNEFAAGLTDETVSADVTRHVQEAIGRFALTFSPAHFGIHWSQVIGGFAMAADATTLRMYSPTMVRYRPLRLLGDAERQEALETVAGALRDLHEADDLDDWERRALIHGYERIQLVLRHFRFFGHDGLSQEVVLTTHVTQAVQKKQQPGSKTLLNAWRTLVLAAQIVEVVAAPSVLHQAGVDYFDLLKLSSPPPAAVAMLPAPQQPALPPPEECVAPEGEGETAPAAVH